MSVTPYRLLYLPFHPYASFVLSFNVRISRKIGYPRQTLSQPRSPLRATKSHENGYKASFQRLIPQAPPALPPWAQAGCSVMANLRCGVALRRLHRADAQWFGSVRAGTDPALELDAGTRPCKEGCARLSSSRWPSPGSVFHVCPPQLQLTRGLELAALVL